MKELGRDAFNFQAYGPAGKSSMGRSHCPVPDELPQARNLCGSRVNRAAKLLDATSASRHQLLLQVHPWIPARGDLPQLPLPHTSTSYTTLRLPPNNNIKTRACIRNGSRSHPFAREGEARPQLPKDGLRRTSSVANQASPRVASRRAPNQHPFDTRLSSPLDLPPSTRRRTQDGHLRQAEAEPMALRPRPRKSPRTMPSPIQPPKPPTRTPSRPKH
jgi:hypothetical protein